MVVSRAGTNIDAHGFAVGRAARGERSGSWMTPRPVLDHGLAVMREVARGTDATPIFSAAAWALDAAAEPGSAVCDRWYGPGSLLRADALTPEPWGPSCATQGGPLGSLVAGPVWLNPPYDQFAPFAERAVVEAERLWVGWLSFARTDTRAFQALWWSSRLRGFAFLPGRVRFVDPTTGLRGQAAPAPSVFLVLGPGNADAVRVRW